MILNIKQASAPIGAWKCNFPPFHEIMTDSPTDHPTDIRVHREVTLQSTYLFMIPICVFRSEIPPRGAQSQAPGSGEGGVTVITIGQESGPSGILPSVLR